MCHTKADAYRLVKMLEEWAMHQVSGSEPVQNIVCWHVTEHGFAEDVQVPAYVG